MKSTDRPVHWIKAVQKDFSKFPDPVQTEALNTLTIVAEGHFTDNLKPLKGFQEKVYEIVLRHRGDAYRVVYVLELEDAVIVVHAFQKKSPQGAKTPQHEIDVIRERIKRLKEAPS